MIIFRNNILEQECFLKFTDLAGWAFLCLEIGSVVSVIFLFDFGRI